ncbi:MAG: DUF1643 domain-containing protein [Phoenicibacter congonensis]|uniref:DUF1643 domain-containing protein n=1 Tax=Phoenicibacter congonensis TaxID=1944646 RepID=A0AA43U9V1_9ACTN|nr:DUF1643 domain-containing protein [Phoenicibacter congonensis]
MRHIPKTETREIDVLSFEDALRDALLPSVEYDVNKWLYVPNFYSEYRYILGTRGENPLIVIGANPSTAAPDALDPTLASAQRVAKNNGYDSFLMLNVYPQRATDPNDMERERNIFLEQQNVEAFKYLLTLSPTKNVWCAWGNLVTKRLYLALCLSSLVLEGLHYDAHWLSAGEPLKSGQPHHPLYLKATTQLIPYDPIITKTPTPPY